MAVEIIYEDCGAESDSDGMLQAVQQGGHLPAKRKLLWVISCYSPAMGPMKASRSACSVEHIVEYIEKVK